MKNYSSQREEISTIKKRNISISLSDADCERLAIKAGLVGLTVDELLRNFIGDLVDGTYSNGSDERMLADEWYKRCSFSFAPESTLLNFLLNSPSYSVFSGSSSNVKSLIDYYDEIQRLRASIAYVKEFPEDCENNIQSLEEDLEDYLIDYHCYVDEFLESNPNADIEKEIPLCRKWLKEYEEITQTE